VNVSVLYCRHIHLRVPALTYFDLTISCESKAVACSTEVIRHATNEPETALIPGDFVRPSGVVQFITSFMNRGIFLSDPFEENRRRHHPIFLPRIP